jgi:hypothetical protein
MDPLQPGDPVRVGSYRLLGRLGSGGMGQVFLGVSPGGRKVAVKVIHPLHAGSAQFRERFAREIEAARRVGGFHTAPVVDADADADPPWMVTAFIDGPSLQDAVDQRGPLPPDELRALGAGLAEGLAAIHKHGLVHRDLKPANVILAPDGPRITPPAAAGHRSGAADSASGPGASAAGALNSGGAGATTGRSRPGPTAGRPSRTPQPTTSGTSPAVSPAAQPASSPVSSSPASSRTPVNSKSPTGSKSPQLVNVPDVLGFTANQAIQALQAAGFKVEVTNAGRATYNNNSARVVSYSPTGQAPRGSTITIQV